MYTERKLLFFQEMISCSYSFYFWTYDAEMHLLDSNCPNEAIFESVFALEHFPDLIMEHLNEADRPFILSNSLGLMWAVVFEHQIQTGGNETSLSPKSNVIYRIHVMGPAFITGYSHSHIEKKLNQYNISIAAKRAMLEQLRLLPIVEANRLMQYVLMFHFCVRDEKISTEDFYHLTPAHMDEILRWQFENGDDPLLPETADMEQALLLAVEQGNLNYHDTLSHSSIVASIKVDETNSLRHYKYPCYRFIVLCCKAACDGGLSRRAAYTLSNVYCEAVDNCQTPSELGKVINKMYDDYVRHVHECKQIGTLSISLRTCRDYIDQNPTEDLSLDTLSAITGYSPYYLSKLFKRETGMTINHYIKKMRIEHAKLLLCSQQATIQQISEQLHFCSSSHFAEAFYKQVGMTPREYRKKYR
jgi:AraC-like DNA-binding protein